MPDHKLGALAECYQVLEETGDLEACRRMHPDLIDELLEDTRLQRSLSSHNTPLAATDLAVAKQRIQKALEDLSRHAEAG